jgi:glycerol-3-phosphate dehydrogenase
MSQASAHQVRSSVSQLRSNPTSQVLVIGGGINGIATFRDLALQGVDVVLVERSDFASGASSASSHMIHGGIRYLENGEFRLVRESVTERNGLLAIAPHYVKPLKTTIPIFSTFSGLAAAPLRFLTHKSGKPKERGAFLIKTGLLFYDSFSRAGGNAVPKHKVHGRRKSLEGLPQLNPALKYTATYFDASVHDPERLALDALKDGLAAGPHARAVNYVEAIGSDASSGGVLLKDVETGDTFTVSADLVVNASGPWTDLTNGALGAQSRFMGGTKGSHIVLDNPALLAATGGREIFFEHEDGRIVLIYPLKGRVLVGTTDIDADMSTRAICTEEEVDYFFELIKHVFPTIAVDRSQIVYRFSGVRPLPRHDDTQPGFVSRDYRVEQGTLPGTRVPIMSLVGGKLTTFRALGAQLSTQVLEALNLVRSVDTAGLPIGGGLDYPMTSASRLAWIEDNRDGLDSVRVERLLERYGTRATEFVDATASCGETPLATLPEYTDVEIAHIVKTEFVVHLVDLVLRRTPLAFVGALSSDRLDELGGLLATALGWSPDALAAEIAATRSELENWHGVVLTPTALRDEPAEAPRELPGDSDLGNAELNGEIGDQPSAATTR